MPDSVAGVVLAAGVGERLRPLTWVRPKVLCPVGDVPLLDRSLERVRRVTGSVAVNVHHHRPAMEAHLSGHPDVHVSVEPERALGTAGALGRLRDWIAGRAVLVVNGDAWAEGDLTPLIEGWDGERPRLLAPGGGRLRADLPVAGALLAWDDVAGLVAEPSGLYAEVWRPAAEAGRLEIVAGAGRFVDCGTPAAYLAANLLVSGGEPVLGAGVTVDGEVVRSVVWRGAEVRAGERLVDAIRTDRSVTVLVR
jgi:mannose-1-phosphate guanylyltransferase/MurNAc alpha-1-phosphate uridylyltransferase